TILCCLLPGTADEEGGLDDVSEPLRICTERIEHSGGTITASFSGQVVACFGYPTAHEDATAAAVRAGLAIVRAVRESSGPAVQVGVHTGYSIVQDQKGTLV